MITLPMTKALLDAISAVQAFKHLAVRETLYLEAIGGPAPVFWMDRARRYFFDLPGTESLGLVRNDYCFEAILGFEVTSEMTKTHFDDLDKFSFTF